MSTGTTIDEKIEVEELTEFLNDEEPRCEINHRQTVCQEVAVARRRFKCVSHGYNMCHTAAQMTLLAIEYRTRNCPCKSNVGDCWSVIYI